jgi:hypothetical protein
MKGVLTLTPYPQGGRLDRQTPKILYIETTSFQKIYCFIKHVI